MRGIWKNIRKGAKREGMKIMNWGKKRITETEEQGEMWIVPEWKGVWRKLHKKNSVKEDNSRGTCQQLAHGCENFCKDELAYAHVGCLWICANKLYVIISFMIDNMLLHDDRKGHPWSWKAHEDTAIILHRDQFSSRRETPELLKLFWFNSHRDKCLKNLFCVIMGYSVQFLRWFQTNKKKKKL